MDGPLAPGEKRKVRAPLPTAALMAGAFLCALALFLAAARTLAQQLASDALVVRALATTLGFTGFLLVRVGLQAAVGWRRLAAVCLGSPLMIAAVMLMLWPTAALVPYTRGWSLLVPWMVGLPGLLSLALSRWRVS